MPKPITSEMLHAMSAAEQKTLHQNATRLNTPAAQAVLALMAQEGWASAAELGPAPAKAMKRRSATATAGKVTRATHGRQS